MERAARNVYPDALDLVCSWYDVHAIVVAKATMTGEPQGKARPRFGRKRDGSPVTYTPTTTRAAESMIGWQLRCALPHGRGMLGDPNSSFVVIASFYVGGNRKLDVDNALKLLLDAANGIVWKDDRQVHEVHARVLHESIAPRTEVAIYRTRGGDV